MQSNLIERRTSRAIILNNKNEILLLKINDKPLHSDNYQNSSSFWVTPGGEIHQNESEKEALRRELREEVGIIKSLEIELIAFGEHILNWKGLETVFIEKFFIVRTNEISLNDRELTTEEIELIAEYRWWSIGEMQMTKEIIFPACLVKLVSEYINHSGQWEAYPISLD